MRNFLKMRGCIAVLILSLMFVACKVDVETRYTVTYSSEHGTVPESISVEENAVLSEIQLPNLTYGNLSFDGWYDGETKAVPGEYRVTRHVTLTARWTAAATCTITFKSNGGTESDHVQTVTTGTTVKLDANTFTCPPGYKCEWNTKSDGSGTSYSDQADFEVETAGNIILYAQWVPVADEFTIVSMIRNMTVSGTIAARGTFSTSLIREINSALKSLPSDVLVTLDLSHVTGLTELENASSSDQGNSFYYCRSLAGIILPDGLISIGAYAFCGCYGLKSVTIPDSVTSIGAYAFCSCKLTSVTIPDSVTSIGEYAFCDCMRLTSVTIPDGVTSIANGAFIECTGLTEITIPSSVKSIGTNAFNGCSGLTSVTIPSGVTSIGYFAFSGCTGLTSVTIPSSITSIGCGVFMRCTGLTSVTIPNTVTSIGEDAFAGCTGLTSVTFADKTSKWYKTSISNYTWGTEIGPMSDAETNATLLKDTYKNYYLYSEKYGQQ